MTHPHQHFTNDPAPADAQYLGVQCGGRLYGVALQRVREIRRALVPLQSSTPEGSAPGMLNLRGQFVPLLHLRSRLGLPACAPGAEVSILVLAVDLPEGPRECALVVDGVSDVVQHGDSVLPPGGGQPQVPVPLNLESLLGDYLRQKAGVNSTSAVNSSTRPSNIATIHTHS